MDNSIHVKYLIANKQDVSWGLVVTTTGYQNIEPNSHYPLNNHPVRYLFSTEKGRILNEYQLVYISRGSGSFASNGLKNTEITEGYIFLLFPGEWHNYSPDRETGWYEYWIGFNGVNIDNRVKAGFFSKSKPIFNVGLHEDIINLYKLSVKTAIEQSSGYQQILAGIVNLLLGFAYSEHRQHTFEDMKVSNQISKAKVIMLENIHEEISCEQIATKVGMSYSWFRRIFKQYTGFAPVQYMLELKVNKSKELLTNTNLTCQEIAFEIGFDTPSYFNTAFKKKTGMTPNQYRDMTRGHAC